MFMLYFLFNFVFRISFLDHSIFAILCCYFILIPYFILFRIPYSSFYFLFNIFIL